jgi:hypothetical protein
MGSYLAAPAEPETLIGLKRLSQCNGQASSGPFAGGVGNRYAIRNNDEARQKKRSKTVTTQKRRTTVAPQANISWFVVGIPALAGSSRHEWFVVDHQGAVRSPEALQEGRATRPNLSEAKRSNGC